MNKTIMPEEITVSVIIPSYNSASYVTEAVTSVLAQSFRNFEILVIDDGSTDNTKEVLEKYAPSIRYLYKPNGGVSHARNYGIENARGKYVAFLDADDLWMPEKLEKQISALEKNTGYKACYSALLVTDGDLQPIRVSPSRRFSNTLEDLLFHGNVVATPSTVLAEKALFDSMGGFDPELSQCADWEMWLRLATQTEFFYIDEPLIKYRQHASNMSNNAPLLEKDSLIVMEKGFSLPELKDSLKARKNEAFARTYMVLAGTYFNAGMYKDFLRCARKAIGLDLTQLNYLLSFPLRRLGRS